MAFLAGIHLPHSIVAFPPEGTCSSPGVLQVRYAERNMLRNAIPYPEDRA